MTNTDNINKLEELLVLDEDQTIVGYKIKRLTAPGENFGSLMLSVDVTVQTPKGTKIIHTVAKLVPPNSFIQEIFNTQVTFRNEIGFYKNIVPILQNFQKEHGVENVIDFVPKYYGSRLNLKNNDEKVDQDAALVLENLKVENFENLDRIEGMDLETAKLILTDLAYLHAVPLALKLQKPDVFAKRIKPYLSTWRVSDQMHADFKRDTYRVSDKLEELEPYLERLHNSFDKLNEISPPREPFATIAHNDLWTNNTMVKKDKGKPVKNILVDFQMCDYGSPAKDVIFFLFTSVKTEVMRGYYDDLVKFYHEKFTSVLLELHCDVAQFSFEAFEKEIDHESKHSQFGHIVFMLNPIFAPKGSLKEISELSPDSMMDVEPTDLQKKKLIFVVEEFAKRNWI